MKGQANGKSWEERVKAAKAYGKAHEFRGAPGGWIYNRHGKAVVQGWLGFYSKYERNIQAWQRYLAGDPA